MQRIHIHTAILTAFWLFFPPDTLSAPIRLHPPQDYSWSAVTRMPAGSRIEVERSGGDRVAGNLQLVDEDEIVLLAAGQSTRVMRSTVRRVTLRSGHKAGIGALWGLGGGAATGLIVNSTFSDAEHPLSMALIVGGMGAGIGALVGLAWSNRTVIYDGSGSAHLQVAPILTSTTQGVRVTFSFDK